MLLSQAVEQGLSEINFNYGCWLRPDGSTCQGCLLGAAMYVKGARDLDAKDPVAELAKHWPWVNGWKHHSKAPCCKIAVPENGWDISELLTHLSLHYEEGVLSKEQIIEMVRRIESVDKYPLLTQILNEAEVEAREQRKQPELEVLSTAISSGRMIPS